MTEMAPLARDSGKHQGKRRVRGGRGAVREILFIVAGVVARRELDFLEFRQRLAHSAKPPKAGRLFCPNNTLHFGFCRFTGLKSTRRESL